MRKLNERLLKTHIFYLLRVLCKIVLEKKQKLKLQFITETLIEVRSATIHNVFFNYGQIFIAQ